MALFEASSLSVGSVIVETTQQKGHDPAFWASKASDKIVSVGGECHPIIADQAEAFKKKRRSDGFVLYPRGYKK